MGMESDQEIVQMVGRDPKYAGILNPSLQVYYLLYESQLNDFFGPYGSDLNHSIAYVITRLQRSERVLTFIVGCRNVLLLKFTQVARRLSI